MTIEIEFHQGTLILRGEITPDNYSFLETYVRFDKRIKAYRAKAFFYRDIIEKLYLNCFPYKDKAKNYQTLTLPSFSVPLRTHQKEAVSEWIEQKKKGVVVLPTGAGKSYVALQAISLIQRSTIILVPTIDLMEQWGSILEKNFNCEVGLLGGGGKEIHDITVSTYDSASLMMEFIGNRFGFIIFDECHHLPSPRNKLGALMCIAPYRMGLTATPEREDEGEEVLYQLCGPICFRKDIDEMEGSVLSPYLVKKVFVPMEQDEREEYLKHHEIYIQFLRKKNISFKTKDGWKSFIFHCSLSPEGREAFKSYLLQRRLARSSRAKLKEIWNIMKRHRGQRILIFTAENHAAYEIGRTFYLPVLTHHTGISERREFLEFFRKGEYPVLVTSKVLNEGVDVPEANVAIVVSGSGTVREHVQRLGRILRSYKGKRAYLYELVSEKTNEYYISQRRGQHRAYKRSTKSNS